MNKLSNIFIGSIVITFLLSVVTEVHGYNVVSSLLNAYSIISFLSLSVFAIFSLFFSRSTNYN